MRILLDENLPRKLKYRFSPDHEVVTVQERGWTGLLNGDLIRAADQEFEAFITLDRGIEHQRNVSRVSLRLIVLRSVSNKYVDLLPLMPSVHEALTRARPGDLVHVAG